MREKLDVNEDEIAVDNGEPKEAYTHGEALAACDRCTAELKAAAEEFDAAFAGRDFDKWFSFFVDGNVTGLGADGTIGMNKESWGKILGSYFEDPTWRMKTAPVKIAVQSCRTGQVIERVRFDSPALGHITFVHVMVWVRDHGDWKIALQTEAGPLETKTELLHQFEGRTTADIPA
ncbi:nuclear transport factor 2 family protein [Streptomyces sp. FH025]|uniref:nuclear transport factor 2 family protein n=1 Tax=Streptomyces sp. FH025 TaxID=2815937 RepID=UPI001A9ED0E3|nr:nuclear transport factor 2 family protein [Streptomyces sp. FH025]MBO1416430.1 nuclear transport factor 2 family protein [Streptomyces sp. FH025]